MGSPGSRARKLEISGPRQAYLAPRPLRSRPSACPGAGFARGRRRTPLRRQDGPRALSRQCRHGAQGRRRLVRRLVSAGPRRPCAIAPPSIARMPNAEGSPVCEGAKARWQPYASSRSSAAARTSAPDTVVAWTGRVCPVGTGATPCSTAQPQSQAVPVPMQTACRLYVHHEGFRTETQRGSDAGLLLAGSARRPGLDGRSLEGPELAKRRCLVRSARRRRAPGHSAALGQAEAMTTPSYSFCAKATSHVTTSARCLGSPWTATRFGKRWWLKVSAGTALDLAKRRPAILTKILESPHEVVTYPII